MKHYFTLAFSHVHLLCGEPLAGQTVTHNRENVTCPDCQVMLVLDDSLVETQ